MHRLPRRLLLKTSWTRLHHPLKTSRTHLHHPLKTSWTHLQLLKTRRLGALMPRRLLLLSRPKDIPCLLPAHPTPGPN